MSLRRISDLAPVEIYNKLNKSRPSIDRTKNMLFEVSYPDTAEGSTYKSNALTYDQLSCALLDGIFDWMFGNDGLDLSGNFYYNKYKNNNTTLRDNYETQQYFLRSYIGGSKAALKLFAEKPANGAGVAEIVAKNSISLRIGTNDMAQPHTSTNNAAQIAYVTSNGIQTNSLTATTRLETPTLAVGSNASVGGTLTAGRVNCANGKISLYQDGNSGIVNATTFTGTAMHALWSDLAEYYVADKPYKSGTLVKFGGEYEITEATSDDEANAVVTYKPGFVLNNELSSENGFSIAIALVGRTPVFVSGKIEKFENIMMSPDIPGVACKHDGISRVIGKALAAKTTDDVGLVECVVKLKL